MAGAYATEIGGISLSFLGCICFFLFFESECRHILSFSKESELRKADLPMSEKKDLL